MFRSDRRLSVFSMGADQLGTPGPRNIQTVPPSLRTVSFTDLAYGYHKSVCPGNREADVRIGCIRARPCGVKFLFYRWIAHVTPVRRDSRAERSRVQRYAVACPPSRNRSRHGGFCPRGQVDRLVGHVRFPRTGPYTIFSRLRGAASRPVDNYARRDYFLLLHCDEHAHTRPTDYDVTRSYARRGDIGFRVKNVVTPVTFVFDVRRNRIVFSLFDRSRTDRIDSIAAETV